MGIHEIDEALLSGMYEGRDRDKDRYKDTLILRHRKGERDGERKEESVGSN